jgi:prepilin-type N-terminal cleavage/methylation domain-containing protein/prepilin-type processing-associated H-X9-DG protein
MRRVRGFSLLELLVVIGIIAVLISILLPALRVARQHSLRIQCMNNLRQIGVGFVMYNNEQRHLPLRFNDKTQFSDEYWGYDEELIRMKVCVGQTFICPLHVDAGFFKKPSQPSYGMNWFFDYQPMTKGSSWMILAAEVQGSDGSGTHRADRDSIPPGELAIYRHQLRSNWLFFDGHVSWLKYEEASGPELRNWGEDLGTHGQ